MERALFITLLICLAATSAMAEPVPMVTAAPYKAAVLDDRDDPLSDLISQGISIGNSVLSNILSHDTTSTAEPAANQTPTPSPAAVTGNAQSSQTSRSGSILPSSTPEPAKITSSQPPNASLSASGAQSSTSGGNRLIVILAAVIGVLVIIVAVLLVWFLIRRRRKRGKGYSDSDDRSSLESPTSATPLTAGRNKPARQPNMPGDDIPAPPSGMLESSRKRIYMPYNPPPADPSPQGSTYYTPPLHPSSSAGSGPAHGRRLSAEIDGTPISPITPTEPLPQATHAAPVEIDSVHLPRVPRKSSRRSRIHYPSIAETSRFDFGFNKDRYARTHAPAKKRPASYNIPRRPVGGLIH